MWLKRLVLVLLLCAITAKGYAAESFPAEWIACREDVECTSIVMGCYYWQPVNQAYADDMEKAYPPNCRLSVPAGPKPISGCFQNACTNKPLTGKYWNRLEMYQKNGFMDDHISACIPSAEEDKTQKMQWNLVTLRSNFIGKMDNLMGGTPQMADHEIQELLRQTFPCKDIETAWIALKNKNIGDESEIKVSGSVTAQARIRDLN